MSSALVGASPSKVAFVPYSTFSSVSRTVPSSATQITLNWLIAHFALSVMFASTGVSKSQASPATRFVYQPWNVQPVKVGAGVGSVAVMPLPRTWASGGSTLSSTNVTVTATKYSYVAAVTLRK